MTSEVDNLPKILDLIHIIICNVFLTSWTFAINQMLFYHRPDSMLVLEINTITWVQFWVSCEFLYYKAQTGWPQENLFKNKNYNHIQVTIDITRWDSLTLPTNTAYSNSGHKFEFSYIQFSSVAQSRPTLCDPMNRSTPGLPVHHKLPEFTQTQLHRVSDAIPPSHPLASPSPPAPNPSQHQSLFQ